MGGKKRIGMKRMVSGKKLLLEARSL